jgi:hypothetical protein
MFKIIAFFKTTLFASLYVRAFLFTCGEHVHGRIISLRVEVWAHKKLFNPATFYWNVGTRPG